MILRNMFGLRPRLRPEGLAEALLETLAPAEPVTPSTDGHPTDERLAAWAEGGLAGAAAEAVAAHVRGCPRCRAAVRDLQAVLLDLPPPGRALAPWCGRLTVAVETGQDGAPRIALRWEPLPPLEAGPPHVDPRALAFPPPEPPEKAPAEEWVVGLECCDVFPEMLALEEPSAPCPMPDPRPAGGEGRADGAVCLDAGPYWLAVRPVRGGDGAPPEAEPRLACLVRRGDAPARDLVLRLVEPAGRQAVVATDARGWATLPLPAREAVLVLGEGADAPRLLVRRRPVR